MREVPVTSISSEFGHIDDLLIDCELYIIELIKANGGEVEFIKYPYLLRRLQATQVVNMANYLIFGTLSQKKQANFSRPLRKKCHLEASVGMVELALFYRSPKCVKENFINSRNCMKMHTLTIQTLGPK